MADQSRAIVSSIDTLQIPTTSPATANPRWPRVILAPDSAVPSVTGGQLDFSNPDNSGLLPSA